MRAKIGQITEWISTNFQSKEHSNNLAMISGILVALFLNVFQPFGISNGNYSLTGILLISGYGLGAGTGIAALAYIYRRRSAAVGRMSKRQFLLFFLIIIQIPYIYYLSIFSKEWNLEEYFTMSIQSISISIVIILILVALCSKKGLANSPKIIHIPSKNKHDFGLRIEEKDLIYAESHGNYIALHYYNKNTISKKLLRNTLTELENICNDSYFINRCHASYIINTKQVRDLSSQGRTYKVHLRNHPTTVPVSSKYIRIIRSILELHVK